MQVIAQYIHNERRAGVVFGLDINPPSEPSVLCANRNVIVQTATCDVLKIEPDSLAKALLKQLRTVSGGSRAALFDSVVSDLSPSTVGHLGDSLKSLEFAIKAVNIACGVYHDKHRASQPVLRAGGNLLVKLIEGNGNLATLTESASILFERCSMVVMHRMCWKYLVCE